MKVRCYNACKEVDDSASSSLQERLLARAGDARFLFL